MKTTNILKSGKNLLLTEGIPDCPEYMIDMFIAGGLEQLIPANISRNKETLKVLYETDIDMTLKDSMEQNGIDSSSLKGLLESIDAVLAQCFEYLLDEGRVLLDPTMIFISKNHKRPRFIYSFFEKSDFRQSCKNLLADILGNYFTGYSLEEERLREKAIREIGKPDFTARKMLAEWNFSNTNHSDKENNDIKPENKEASATEKIITGIWKKITSKSVVKSETEPVFNNSGSYCLTGICSIQTKIPVRTEGITVGRTLLEKDYGLFNNGIGKEHARIYEKDGKIFITDLGSKNGTYINGERIEKRIPFKIEKGDIVAFSDEEFILC